MKREPDLKRKQVLIKQHKVDLIDFDGETLDDVVSFFSNLRDEYREEYPDVSTTIAIDHYGYDGYFEFSINLLQKESDESYNARLEEFEKIRQKDEAKRIEKERKLYEQLKKKYDHE